MKNLFAFFTVLLSLSSSFANDVYVGCFASVNVIDSDTNTVVASIPMHALTAGIVISPDGKYAYATHYSESTNYHITVIDTSTRKAIGKIPTGARTGQITLTADGKYAYIASDTSVCVVDLTFGKVIRAIPVSDVPGCIAVTPDGKYAYVTFFHNGNVSVIDTTSGSVIKTLSLGASYPWGVVITSDGAYACVADGLNSIYIISTRTNSVVGVIPIGNFPMSMAFTPDEKYLYVTANSTVDGKEVVVIDTQTRTITNRIPLTHGPTAIAITPDGTTAYVAAGNDKGTVYAIDTRSKAVVKTITVLPRSPLCVAITPSK